MNENEDQNNPRLIQSNGVNNDTLSGTDSSGLTLENVNFDATATTSENAFIDTFNTNLSPSGTNVSVSAVSGSGSVPSCSFPALPGL